MEACTLASGITSLDQRTICTDVLGVLYCVTSSEEHGCVIEAANSEVWGAVGAGFILCRVCVSVQYMVSILVVVSGEGG